MARARVKIMRTRAGIRWRAAVVSQDVLVWADDGWASQAEAMDRAALIVVAFTITDELGQKHRPWSAVVDEAAGHL